jgi:hypothetical protein
LGNISLDVGKTPRPSPVVPSSRGLLRRTLGDGVTLETVEVPAGTFLVGTAEATHLFEELSELEEVSALAAGRSAEHLRSTTDQS